MSRIITLGTVYATPGALDTFDLETLIECLQRHARGDWGDLCQEDWEINENAVVDGGRLMSVYNLGAGRTLWIITEWDRGITTMLLPEDY